MFVEENDDSRKQMLLKLALTANMQIPFLFCEMCKGNSDHLLNLSFDNRKEHTPKVINYFTETLPRFT